MVRGLRWWGFCRIRRNSLRSFGRIMGYDVGGSLNDPDALLVRSAKLHDAPIPDSVLAIGR